ncbi:hypothetical protein [Roseospira visakhapatnamensis]|uniref:Uncharacterized protein n=1 Tax=Roseospira visakhapatnamensis TaxID=390880 RepID=A0A7W6RFU6_9PROT|nr:hypothetical protein [Roseospira visakhapatnamensis]MBB4267805.1 hypothetical protein [Roseospira visakhapatnamensis]
MGSQVLSADDLSVMENEPRIHDLRLAERLGFRRERDVRKLIERNRTELSDHGEVCATVAQTSEAGGRPATEYWLNEGQALVICMLSRTRVAAQVRREVITVFMAWRRGMAPPAPTSAPDPWAAMSARLDAVERALGMDDSRLEERVTYLPIWKDGRRFRFWHDREVRAFLIVTHRQMSIDRVHAACLERFGEARTPSRSAIGRLYQRLDTVRGTTEGRA